MEAKRSDDNIELLASAARTATDTGTTPVTFPPMVRAIAFTLDVSAAATESGDILAVFIQTRLDGTNWLDVVAFTTALGNGSAKRYIAKVTADLAVDDFEASATLSASEVRNFIGDAWRARFTVTDAGDDNASFTFRITGCPM